MSTLPPQPCRFPSASVTHYLAFRSDNQSALLCLKRLKNVAKIGREFLPNSCRFGPVVWGNPGFSITLTWAILEKIVVLSVYYRNSNTILVTGASVWSHNLALDFAAIGPFPIRKICVRRIPRIGAILSPITQKPYENNAFPAFGRAKITERER